MEPSVCNSQKFGQILIIFQNDNKIGLFFGTYCNLWMQSLLQDLVTNGLLVLNCYYRGTSQLSNTLKVSSSSLHFGLKENMIVFKAFGGKTNLWNFHTQKMQESNKNHCCRQKSGGKKNWFTNIHVYLPFSLWTDMALDLKLTQGIW